MQRVRATVLGCLLGLGALLGPAAVTVHAFPAPTTPIVATGWTCHPDGSGGGILSTTNSVAVIFPSLPALDSITCVFSGLSPFAAPIGHDGIADCYYNETPTLGIEFAHRSYQVFGSVAILFCWDGTPIVPCVLAISGPSGQTCTSQPVGLLRRTAA